MHSNGLKLSGALKEISITSQFLGSKRKNQLFEGIKNFEISFYRIEVKVLTNPSSRRENHQTLSFLLMTDFFFKISISAFSGIFENHQLHILKS